MKGNCQVNSEVEGVMEFHNKTACANVQLTKYFSKCKRLDM